jgi:WD40 repeat protein
MKWLLTAMRAAPVVLLVSFVRSLALAEDAQALRLVKTCPLPGSEKELGTSTIVSLLVCRRGDTDVVGAVSRENLHVSAPAGSISGPGESIVLANWDEQKAELSLRRRVDRLACGICGVSVADDLSCVFARAGFSLPRLDPPNRQAAAAYVLGGTSDPVQLGAPEDVGTAIGVSPDGRLIAWGCRGGCVRVRSVSSDRDLLTISIDRDKVGELTFSNDGRMLSIVTSREQGFTRTLFADLQRQGVVATLTSTGGSRCAGGRFSPRGNAYGTTTKNDHILTCNFESGLATEIPSPHDHYRGAFAFSSDAGLVISGGWTEDGHRRPRSRMSRGRVESPPGVVGEIKVWDSSTNKVVMHVQEPRLGEIRSLALSPDDRFLFVGDSGGQIGIFDFAVRRKGRPSLPQPSSPAGEKRDGGE